VLALKRLGRCRPFTAGGYDPVPEHLDAGASSSPVTHEGPLAPSPGYQRPLR
jgi:putative component of membrane protein insertase Oxa1/YidC/SpoIIIJ protein YidD